MLREPVKNVDNMKQQKVMLAEKEKKRNARN